MIKILNNHVLVLPHYDHYDKVGDFEINTSYEKEVHFPSSGTVVAVPYKLNYSTFAEDRESLMFDVDMQVKEGDTVIFGYNIVPQALQSGKSLGNHVLIKYDNLFCAIRDEKIIMLNGYIIVEAIEDMAPAGDILLPDHLRSVNHFQKGKVLHIGDCVRRYRFYPEIGGDLLQMKAGQDILFHMQHSIPLQYAMHSIIDDKKELYRMQQKDVSAIYQNA